ncbi:MAG: Stp1/IreP family PP2C-type Ser/Thr phosphatase [Clostridium sp.]
MIGVISDIGMVRSLNEDYALYEENSDYGIYVVADGMGGHNAGEVASKMAAEGIISYIKENYSLADSDNLLKNAILKVNEVIFRKSLEREHLSGMGTTVTATFITKDFIQVANVGDSCCFGINGDFIEKITKDHSLVQELLDTGGISEEEASKHPKKNIITRAIGTNIIVEVDIFNIPKDKYKSFLLCSDGLANEVSKEEFITVIQEEKNYYDACERLVNLAKYNGGRDNITVLLFGGEI